MQIVVGENRSLAFWWDGVDWVIEILMFSVDRRISLLKSNPIRQLDKVCSNEINWRRKTVRAN